MKAEFKPGDLFVTTIRYGTVVFEHADSRINQPDGKLVKHGEVGTVIAVNPFPKNWTSKDGYSHLYMYVLVGGAVGYVANDDILVDSVEIMTTELRDSTVNK